MYVYTLRFLLKKKINVKTFSYQQKKRKLLKMSYFKTIVISVKQN